MQKHLIKQVFVAIWMWWLVERRKKMGNLCMKSIIETVFLWISLNMWYDHTNNTVLNEFCIIFSYNHKNQPYQTHSQYSLLGPLHRIIWNFRFRIQLFPRIIQHAWTFFWISIVLFQTVTFNVGFVFFESELKFCSYKREKWTLVKLLQNKYH